MYVHVFMYTLCLVSVCVCLCVVLDSRHVWNIRQIFPPSPSPTSTAPIAHRPPPCGRPSLWSGPRWYTAGHLLRCSWSRSGSVAMSSIPWAASAPGHCPGPGPGHWTPGPQDGWGLKWIEWDSGIGHPVFLPKVFWPMGLNGSYGLWMFIRVNIRKYGITIGIVGLGIDPVP